MQKSHQPKRDLITRWVDEEVSDNEFLDAVQHKGKGRKRLNATAFPSKRNQKLDDFFGNKSAKPTKSHLLDLSDVLGDIDKECREEAK